MIDSSTVVPSSISINDVPRDTRYASRPHHQRDRVSIARTGAHKAASERVCQQNSPRAVPSLPALPSSLTRWPAARKFFLSPLGSEIGQRPPELRPNYFVSRSKSSSGTPWTGFFRVGPGFLARRPLPVTFSISCMKISSPQGRPVNVHSRMRSAILGSVSPLSHSLHPSMPRGSFRSSSGSGPPTQ